jgi:hypothetical protein
MHGTEELGSWNIVYGRRKYLRVGYFWRLDFSLRGLEDGTCVRNPKCEGLGAGLEIAQLEVFVKRIFKSFIGRYSMYSLDSKFTFAPTKT